MACSIQGVAKTDELQIERPRQFLRNERTFQRVGRIALLLFVLAGLLGLFGDGPISHAVSRVGTTELTYDRFGRMTSPTQVVISVQTSARDGDPVRIRIERAFLERLSELEVRPSDALVRLENTFAVFEVAASGGRGHLELHYKCDQFGVLQTQVMPESGEAATLWQLLYF